MWTTSDLIMWYERGQVCYKGGQQKKEEKERGKGRGMEDTEMPTRGKEDSKEKQGKTDGRYCASIYGL